MYDFDKQSKVVNPVACNSDVSDEELDETNYDDDVSDSEDSDDESP